MVRFLLDTHILMRWLLTPQKLTKEQLRVLRDAESREEVVAISAISLLELATLFRPDDPNTKVFKDVLAVIEDDDHLEVIALTPEIAREVTDLTVLRDPSDMAIVATARIHGLRLLTSDQRIIDSRLVPIIH